MRPAVPGPGAGPGPAEGGPPPLANPYHAVVLVADLPRFSALNDAEQMATRKAMYDEFRTSFTGPNWDSCYSEDRGDGLVIVVPARIPKALVLGEFIPRLDASLGRRRRSDPVVRLRVAAHAGEVYFDDQGLGGHAVNETFRLCDSAPLREALAATRGDLALIISDVLHDNVVRAGHPGIDPAAFHEVDVRVKETSMRGWLCVPGDDATARQVADRAAPKPAETAVASNDVASNDVASNDAVSNSGISISAGHDVRIGPRNVIANGDVTMQDPPPRRWRKRR